MKIIPLFSRLAGLLILLMILTGCLEARRATIVAAPAAATGTPAINLAQLTEPDLARGQQVYLDKQCAPCHGSVAEGGIGPQMTGTGQPFDQFLHQIRTALPPKPAFNDLELTTQDAYNIYGWLQSLKQAGATPAVSPAVLSSGQVLGMKVWAEGQCDTCHGAFAQGSPNGPTLVGLSFPFEMERAKMRQTAATIPEHAAEHMDDTLFQRLYKWLQAGANPGEGC